MRLGAAALLALAACGEPAGGDASDAAPRDAAPPGACRPPSTADAGLELGTGHPFTPLGDAPLPVEAGPQGGYHVWISLRARGPLDPDAADVSMTLRDGDRRLSEAYAPGVLLLLSEGACDYDNVRLPLLDAQGGLLGEDALPSVVDRPLTLDAEVATRTGTVSTTGTVSLRWP